MLKLLKYLKKKDWLQVFCGLIFICAQVWLDLKLPDYMSEITTLVQTPDSPMSSIWAAGGKMLLCALGSLASSIIVGFFAARLAATLSCRLRDGIYKKVESFSMEEISNFSISSLITRSTNDITQIQMIIAMGMQVMIKAPIMAVWAILKIAGKSWQWSFATGCAVIILVLIVSTLMLFALPKFKAIQK